MCFAKHSASWDCDRAALTESPVAGEPIDIHHICAAGEVDSGWRLTTTSPRSRGRSTTRSRRSSAGTGGWSRNGSSPSRRSTATASGASSRWLHRTTARGTRSACSASSPPASAVCSAPRPPGSISTGMRTGPAADSRAGPFRQVGLRPGVHRRYHVSDHGVWRPADNIDVVLVLIQVKPVGVENIFDHVLLVIQRDDLELAVFVIGQLYRRGLTVGRQQIDRRRLVNVVVRVDQAEYVDEQDLGGAVNQPIDGHGVGEGFPLLQDPRCQDPGSYLEGQMFAAGFSEACGRVNPT